MSRRSCLFPLLALLCLVPAGTAVAKPHRVCVPVRAEGVGQDLGGGRTTATISAGGVVLGTTQAVFALSPPSGTVARFTGPITFTRTGVPGALTATVAGRFDVAAGTFRARSERVTGTGAFAPVSGKLRFAGIEDFATGTFTETITGRLCAAV